MRRVIFDVPRWSVFLHREARGLQRAESWDPKEKRLEDELFERLYAGDAEVLPEREQEPTLRDWARKVHDTAGRLPDFTRLAQECSGDSDAAALAVEALAAQLWPVVQAGQPKAGMDPELRQSLRAGCGAASAQVEGLREAKVALEGLGLGRGSGPAPIGATEAEKTRSLAQRLKDDRRLVELSALAGRFKRLAARKRREKVRHGVDEVTDVEPGGDLARLLPVELGKLLNPKLRLALLRDVHERTALQYRLQGVDTKGRGPLVVALDKSGSMSGPPDLWASAVCLALLDLAQRDRRRFALVCFDEFVRSQIVVSPGTPLPEELLLATPHGGTDLGRAIERGLELIQEHPGQLRKADLVLITDGLSEPVGAPALRARAAKDGVSILGMGIGVQAASLLPWCDSAFAVTDLRGLGEREAEALFTL